MTLKSTHFCAVVLAACAMWIGGTPAGTAVADFYDLELGGELFRLEVAADEATRAMGLSGRQSIDANGGMMFVFPEAAERWFYMRDCLVPIDILFLDGAGTITASYTMQPEEPRAEDESERAYTRRLRRYHSLVPSQYAIELRARTIERIGLMPGDRVMLDKRRLRDALDQ